MFVSAGLALCQAEVVHPSPMGLVSAVCRAHDGERCTYLSWRVRSELHDPASDKSDSGRGSAGSKCVFLCVLYVFCSNKLTGRIFEMDQGVISLNVRNPPFQRTLTCEYTLSVSHTRTDMHAVTGAVWPSSCLQLW